MFAQLRRRLVVRILLILQALCILHTSCTKGAGAIPAAHMQFEAELFSPDWVKEFAADEVGCVKARGLYTWRRSGFGSNINNLLNAWVYGLVVEGWTDVALFVDSDQLTGLECSKESGGNATSGFSCLFDSMPHLCPVNSTEEWEKHLIASGVTQKERNEAVRVSASVSTIRTAHITPRFNNLKVDQRGAKAAMAKFLWSFITPWILRDTRTVTHTRQTFENAPFIGLHIRRGDKIVGRAIRYKHEEYLKEAMKFVDDESSGLSVEDVKAIWVASDDVAVVHEVRELAGAYFPNVIAEDIVCADGGVEGAVKTTDMVTHSIDQSYGSVVYLIADLQQLAAANVFVGTCSSNLGRLTMLLRDGLGKAQNSAISLDDPWTPRRGRLLDEE
eukprot:jgi/Undpi1/368/HiC_scaffold_1.g00364.m1